MQISNTELRALYMHWQEDLASSAQVLDVAIPAMLRPPWDCPGTLPPDLGLNLARRTAGVDVLGFGGLGDDAVEFVGADEFPFALVPDGEDFGGRGTAHDSGVDEAWEADVGDVAGGAEDTFEVPDGFCTVRIQYVSSVEDYISTFLSGGCIRIGIDFI